MTVLWVHIANQWEPMLCGLFSMSLQRSNIKYEKILGVFLFFQWTLQTEITS
jgi:hypothetical protein